MKTKLGISVGLFGAAIYFLGLFSGYLAMILLVGYVLLFEQDAWLRKSAVKAMTIMLLFSIISGIITLIPGAISVIDDALNIFNISFSVSFVQRIVTFITGLLGYLEKILLLVLGIQAVHQQSVNLGIIDQMIDKHMKAE